MIPVRRHTRRRVKAGGQVPIQYLRRAPPDPDMDRLTPRIRELRESLEKRVGAYGEKKGAPLTEEQIRGLESTSKLDFDEHFAFQETQAWAHASGILSTTEAQIVYNALGVVGSAENGGWAPGTDLATKIIINKLMLELLTMKRKMR